MRKIEKRIILLNVIDEYVSGDGVSVGAQGSHDDVILRISFSESWEGTTKRVEWINAVGESVGVTPITPLMMYENQNNVFDVLVPAGVKEHGGEITVTVQGVVIDEETSLETVKIRTEEAHFRVLKSFSGITEIDDVTPSQAEQLQAEIDSISSDINRLSKAADDAEQSATRAEECAKDVEADKKETSEMVAQTKENIAQVEEKLNKAKNYVDKTFASVIRAERIGRTLTLDDISPIEADFNIKFRSKNLIPYPYETPFSVLEEAGSTVTDNGDGSFILNGTATKSVDFIFASHLQLEAYTDYYLTSYADTSQMNGSIVWVNDTQDNTIVAVEGTFNETFPMDLKVFLSVQNSCVFDNVLFTPQIELGNKKTDFAPYCKAEDITISAKGKNLVSFEPHTENDNGLDVIYGEDGIITLLGKKNSEELDHEGKPFTPSIVFDVPLDPTKTYIAKINTYNQDQTIFAMIDDYEGEVYEWYALIREIKGQDKVRLTVKPQSNYTYSESDNLKFELQVIPGNKETQFEKGTETQLTLNEDGTVKNADKIDSSVGATLTAYPEGAVIDILYNADTKKYADETYLTKAEAEEMLSALGITLDNIITHQKSYIGSEE